MTLPLLSAGLESTILVPVLFRVLMATLTEGWGWDFVGLVVPGYLSSVLLLQPGVAAVVLIEAALTYGLVEILDAGATRAGLSFPVVGRDRRPRQGPDLPSDRGEGTPRGDGAAEGRVAA